MCAHRKGAMLMSVALFYRRNDVQPVLLKVFHRYIVKLIYDDEDDN